MYDDIKQLVKKFYKTDTGEPFILTEGQAEIFDLIFKKKYSRVHCETCTRFGKSEVVSQAVLTRVSTFPEKWAIIAGQKEKARIIIGYIIKHIFDNEYTKARFVIEKGESEENIRRYRNKDRINFNVGNGLLGEVFITTASNALGFGASNIVLDEAALVNEKDFALVMRMLGDQIDNFLCKVGNPWDSEHFDKSREDPRYHKVIIDYHQAIKEGRLTEEYVEEMKQQPFFGVLYECKRPPFGIMDEKGWIPLLTKDEVRNAFIDSATGFGIKKLGVDVAGGGRNFSVIVQRHSNYAKIIHKTKNPDTMTLAERVINQKNKEEIQNNDIFIDKVGIGKGAYDILTREITGIRGVNGGAEPTTEIEKEKFVNLRAEMFWKARQWILGGGKLEKHEDWFQLAKIKYRTKLEGTKGKMIIMSKEEMIKNGIDSPDIADSLAMTFSTPDIPPLSDEARRRQEQEQGGFDPFSLFPDVG